MSMFGGNVAVPSLADIAAVTRNNQGYGGYGGGDWWAWLIILVLFGENGFGNGYGGGNGRGAAQIDASLQRGFDTQTIINKLDGLNGGVCNLGYEQLSQTNDVNTNISQTGNALQQAIYQNTVGNMQNTNAIMNQQSDCCCKTQTGFMNLVNQMDKNSCATNTNIHQTGDAIIQNQNQGFQMLNNTIKDGFCSLEMREMQRENQALRDRLNNCDRDAALQGTASYIINSVRPTPTPAWIVDNPWAGCNCNNGWNNSCCGNNRCC